MNKLSLFCFQWAFIPLLSYGVSNGDFSDTNSIEDSLQGFKLQQGAALDLSYAFQGLHAVNSCGWYLTTTQTIEKISKKNIFYNKIPLFKGLTSKHEKLDLVLVKFNGFEEVKEISTSHFLEYLADKKDIRKYPWVLSLARVPSNGFGYMSNSVPSFEGPLQVVSQIIDKKEGNLVLSKGNREDFYSTSISFFKNKKENLIKKRLDQIEELVKETSKHLFAKKYISENFNAKIKSLEKTLEDLNISKEFFFNSLNELRQHKINIGLRPSLDLLEQSIESLKEKILSEKSLKRKLLDYSDLSNDPIIETLWEKYVEGLQTEKENILDDKETLERKSLSNRSIDDIWLFDTPACNGVADQKDIGGGIYSYPGPYRLIKDSKFPPKHKLVGITVAGGKEGETSFVVDLTESKIREWIVDTMLEYYNPLDGKN